MVIYVEQDLWLGQCHSRFNLTADRPHKNGSSLQTALSLIDVRVRLIDHERISRFDEVMACDQPRFNGFFHAMLDRGVYLAPSAFEAGFVSITHSDDDIDATIQAARDAFNTL